MTTTQTHSTAFEATQEERLSVDPLDVLESHAGTEMTTAEAVELHTDTERTTGEKVPAAVSPPSAPIARTRRRRHSYSPAMADQICARMVETDSEGWPRGFRQICEDPDMPSRSSIMTWLREREDFASQHIEARRLQGVQLYEKLLYLLSTVDAENWKRRRIQIDGIFRVCERLLPALLRKSTEVETLEKRETVIRFDVVNPDKPLSIPGSADTFELPGARR
ncbi:MAG: hypothetical protein AAF657_14030 [Acidobacteriota bacterium]